MTSPVLRALPLRAGAAGDAVVDLQQRLRGAGLRPRRRPARRARDRDAGGGHGVPGAARGLRVDGICGDETWGCAGRGRLRPRRPPALPAGADAARRRRRRAAGPPRRTGVRCRPGRRHLRARHRPGRHRVPAQRRPGHRRHRRPRHRRRPSSGSPGQRAGRAPSGAQEVDVLRRSPPGSPTGGSR